MHLQRCGADDKNTAISFDDSGYGSITVREPGEYVLRLVSKATVTTPYVVEASVGVDNPVAMDESAQQLVGAIRFAAAPKLHIVEFAGPESVIIDKLAVATPGTVVRVRLVVKVPGQEPAESESEEQ